MYLNFIPLNKDILFFSIHYFRLLANKSKPFLRLADVMKTFIKKNKCIYLSNNRRFSVIMRL